MTIKIIRFIAFIVVFVGGVIGLLLAKTYVWDNNKAAMRGYTAWVAAMVFIALLLFRPWQIFV